MDIKSKYKILEGISSCVPENGSAEDEKNLLQNFLPRRSYNRLADEKSFLITGGRGSGKTELHDQKYPIKCMRKVMRRIIKVK